MTDLEATRCIKCKRMTANSQLHDGVCCLCIKDRRAKRCHSFYLVATSIAAIISSIGLIFCLWST